MYLTLFAKKIPKHYNHFAEPTGFSQSKYNVFDQHFPYGKCSKYLGHFMNYAVSLLQPRETHLQLGSDCARTLAYAMLGNYSNAHYALGLPMQEKSWFQQRKYPPVHIHPESYDRLIQFRRCPLPLRSVGVCFFSVTPGEEKQIQDLHLLQPYFADRALIIFDHGNKASVRAAVNLWVKEHPESDLLFDLKTPIPNHPTWGDGVLALAFAR